MRNDKFFKHDASASSDEKIMNLLQKEGLKGYGAYWVILETLRNQTDFTASYELLQSLAFRLRVRKAYLIRIVKDFGLFCCEKGGFYSPGMQQRLAKYQALVRKLSVKPNVKVEDNSLNNNKVSAVNARKQDRIGKDLNLTVIDAAELDGQLPIQPYPGWEALVDEMETNEDFMNRAGIHSGLRGLYIRNRKQIVEIFKNHILLQGRQDRIMTVGEAQSYFSNFVADGSYTNKKIRQALIQDIQKQGSEDVYRFEERVGGKRMYLGHPIPDDAPPRPDASAVWDDVLRKWGR